MIVQPEPPTLASYQNTSAPIGQVAAKIYDGLLEYDFDLKPNPSLATSLDGKPRRQDDHVQAARRRQVPRRHAVHQRRRPVHDHGRAAQGPSARPDHVPRPASPSRRRTRTPPSSSSPAPAPYMMVALSGYESPIVPKHIFRARRPENQPVREQTRSARARSSSSNGRSGQYMRLRPQSRLLAQGPALPRPDRRALHRRCANAHRRDARSSEAQIAAFSAVPSVDDHRLKAMRSST